MYRDKTNVEPEMYDYTNNNWSHWNSNEKLKEKFGSCTRKTFDRFITKDSYTWNITHNTESTAVWNLKPERWGSPLGQEKSRKKRSVTRDIHINNNNIIIIIINTEAYSRAEYTARWPVTETEQIYFQFQVLNVHFLKSITFIGPLMHSVLQNSKDKIYVVSIFKDD